MLSELSTEPITVGGNGYTIRAGSRVQLLDDHGHLASPEWLVTRIRQASATGTDPGYTVLDVCPADLAPVLEAALDEVYPCWAFPVGTPFQRIR